MSRTSRILLSVGIVAADSVAFALPLTAIFLAYIIILNPRWFRDFLNGLDR